MSGAEAAWLKAAKEQQQELIFLPKPREVSLRPMDEHFVSWWEQSQGKMEKIKHCNCTGENTSVVKALNKQPVKCGKYSCDRKET